MYIKLFIVGEETLYSYLEWENLGPKIKKYDSCGSQYAERLEILNNIRLSDNKYCPSINPVRVFVSGYKSFKAPNYFF